LGAEEEGLGTPSWDDYFFAGLIPKMRSSERLPSGVMAYIGARLRRGGGGRERRL